MQKFMRSNMYDPNLLGSISSYLPPQWNSKCDTPSEFLDKIRMLLDKIINNYDRGCSLGLSISIDPYAIRKTKDPLEESAEFYKRFGIKNPKKAEAHVVTILEDIAKHIAMTGPPQDPTFITFTVVYTIRDLQELPSVLCGLLYKESLYSPIIDQVFDYFNTESDMGDEFMFQVFTLSATPILEKGDLINRGGRYVTRYELRNPPAHDEFVVWWISPNNNLFLVSVRLMIRSQQYDEIIEGSVLSQIWCGGSFGYSRAIGLHNIQFDHTEPVRDTFNIVGTHPSWSIFTAIRAMF